MARRPGRNHSPDFKGKVASAAVNGERSLSELSQQFDVHPNQITQCKTQLLSGAAEAFDGGQDTPPPVDIKTLHARIGQLTLENDFLEGALTRAEWLSARK